MEQRKKTFYGTDKAKLEKENNLHLFKRIGIYIIEICIKHTCRKKHEDPIRWHTCLAERFSEGRETSNQLRWFEEEEEKLDYSHDKDRDSA